MKISSILVCSILIFTSLFIAGCSSIDRETEEERKLRVEEDDREQEYKMRSRELERQREDDAYEARQSVYERERNDLLSKEHPNASRYSLTFLEEAGNSLWVQNNNTNFSHYYDFGDPDGRIEGDVIVAWAGYSEDFPELKLNETASIIEESFHDKFRSHKANGLKYAKKFKGQHHTFQQYTYASKDSLYVDVHSIYSTDACGHKFIIVVEKCGGVTDRFFNSYGKFLRSLEIKEKDPA